MKVNLEFHKEENIPNNIELEEKLNSFIDKAKNGEPYYEKNIENSIDFEKMYYLTSISQNIINWYNFKQDCSILEIGSNLGNITGVLSSKANNVTVIEPNLSKAKIVEKRHKKKDNIEIIVGNLKDINITEKYDYITLIGVIPYLKEIMGQECKIKQFITFISNYLKEDGILLIALDNKFGLKNFTGNSDNVLNKKFVSILGYNNEEEKIPTFTKKTIQDKLKKCGFENINFYYPLPDYRLPNVIFSDKNMPKYNSIDKYVPYINKNSDILINEIDAFREILKSDEEMFTFFTNSFLIEASKSDIQVKYKYISFNNMRKEEYRLITKIADEYVEKEQVNDISKKHYENIKNNIKLLENKNIKTLDYIKDGKIYSKFTPYNYMLNEVLTTKLEEDNKEEFYNIIDGYINNIMIDSYKEDNYENTIFAAKEISLDEEEKELIKQFRYLKNGLWDMVFKNCFYIDGEYYFFDQEWNNEGVPVEYILYRSILYTISLRRYINIEEIFDKYNLTIYKNIFEKLDNKMQEEIRSDKIWQFYSINKDFDIDFTKQEMKNMSIREKAQIEAIQNLEKENINLKEKLNNAQNSKISYKVKKGLKKLLGGK